MKDFKLRFIYAICVVVVCALYLLAERSGLTERKQAHFTVTADTNVSKVPGLSKYVTQEEVDSFAFRYWDIDYNSNPKNVFKEPAIDVELKRLLKSKQTDEILKFMKDNNLSVDHTMHGGVTPVMYSSFWDDTNTTQELIKLGADIHKKDEYKLSAMAYAIENNATKAVRLLLDNDVKFEEAEVVRNRLLPPNYNHIKSLQISDDGNFTLIYETDYPMISIGEPNYFFSYLTNTNMYEIAKMALESGYKPYIWKFQNSTVGLRYGNDIKKVVPEGILNDKAEPTDGFDITEYDFSLYNTFPGTPNYEPILKLLMQYNVGGQPSPEFLKRKYDDCHRNYIYSLDSYYKINYDATYYIPKSEISLITTVYRKYCKDRNSTFKDVYEYTKFASELNEMEAVSIHMYTRDKDGRKLDQPYKDNLKKLDKYIDEISSDEIKNAIKESYEN
nr:ankyrin repeat domain-containing protein [uncultured Campylobacter sp.]